MLRRLFSRLARRIPGRAADAGEGGERRPCKADSLRLLKTMGAPVGSVLDVGVQACTVELLEAFPDKPHLLMEPVVEHNDAMRRIYAETSFEIVNVAVSDTDGEVTLRTSSMFENYGISHARMVSEDGQDQNLRTVPMRTLDSLVAGRDLPKPYFLKIDVDGAELQVLAGAAETLKDVSVVMIEVGITNLLERIQAVMAAGFEPFDVVDISYYDGRWVQCDMVFLSRQLIQENGWHPYAKGLDTRKWRVYGKQPFRSGSAT